MNRDKNPPVKKSENNYRTRQFSIRLSDPLYPYLDSLCLGAKNLYNAALFRIRQVMTGIRKEAGERQPNEREVLAELRLAFPGMNRIRQKSHLKALAKEPAGELERKEARLKPFRHPTAEKWYVGYEIMDAWMKVTKNPNYLALPAHTAQEALKCVHRSFKSYFKSLNAWKENPEAFTGRPKPPKYRKKDGRMTAVISNTSGKIVKKGADTFLKLPGTKLGYSLSQARIPDVWKLMEIRAVPDHGRITLELVFRVPEDPPLKKERPLRRAAVDPGVVNLAAITNNFGEAPMLVKGGMVRSRNQLYNKRRAHYQGILRQGKKAGDGPYVSKRLQSMDRKCNAFMRDCFHKASRRIIDWCVSQDVDTLVLGLNPGWKQNAGLGEAGNQNFVQISFSMLAGMLRYKASKAGIRFIETEESYTSRADFLERDTIPEYGKEEGKPAFSGKRIRRGLYRSGSGKVINADVNGSANILRKAVPDALHTREWDSGVLKAPVALLAV